MTRSGEPRPRAVILGGTGAIGGATALRLLSAGWSVDVTGREPGRMPAELAAAGARFHRLDRSDRAAVAALLGSGTELLVDLLAFRGADVAAVLPLLADVDSAVLVSSRAVYRDAAGRHLNGSEPPRFPAPLGEDTPTLDPAPDEADPFTRTGYGPGKAAAEAAALGSGRPITVLRPAKVHGRWARNARTGSTVRRMLAGTGDLEVADAGSLEHLTGAGNVARVIEAVARNPAQRVLNVADPEPVTARAIFETIAAEVGWAGTLRPIRDPATPERGDHPWRTAHPVLLDTARARALTGDEGFPGPLAIAEEARWVAEGQRRRNPA